MSTILDRPHVQGSATSAAAAASHSASDAATMRARVLAYIRSRGIHGATRLEIQDALGMSGDTVRPRVCELIARGLIETSGEIRRTASGRPSEVLVAREGEP